MQNLEPSHHIRRVEAYAEMHFRSSGLYTLETAQAFIKELTIKTMPLIEARIPFSVFGDMTDWVPQTREVAAAIRDQILAAKTVGLQRVAIAGASTLAKMQYARLANEVEVDFFICKEDALAWLRSRSAKQLREAAVSH